MPRIVHFVYSLVTAALLLWVADAVLQPVPMPVGGAVLFAFIAYWTPHGTMRRCIIGAAIGLAIGAVAHSMSHILEDRVDAVTGMALHVAADAAISAIVATVILAISISPIQLIHCRCSHTPKTSVSV